MRIDHFSLPRERATDRVLRAGAGVRTRGPDQDEAEKVEAAKLTYPKVLHAGLDAGLLALYQRCTHLGCRVPVCSTSGMLECPCHSGVFSAYGEWRAGPPPRGMDHFAIAVRRGRILIDTAHVVPGLDKTVDVSGQVAEGPHCI